MSLVIREYEIDHPIFRPTLSLYGDRDLARLWPPVPVARRPVAGPTFKEAAERYFNEVIEVRRAHRSIQSVRSLLGYHLYPEWADRPLASITKSDIKALLRKIGSTRTMPYGDRRDGRWARSNSAFWILRKFFQWCCDDDEGVNLLNASPAIGIRQPYPILERERVLTDSEIRWFWQATGELGFPIGPVSRLLLLTGQRRSEIANLEKQQVDRESRMLRIPIRSDKSRRGHLVPLSDLAMEILDQVPRLPGRPLLFSRDGVTPLWSAFTTANQRLHRRMVELCRAETAEAGGDPDAVGVEWFVFHDLRRTAATLMCRLGHPLEVVDRVMNHAGGKSGTGRTLNSVTRIYCRHEFLDERGAALQDLGRHVAALTIGSDFR